MKTKLCKCTLLTGLLTCFLLLSAIGQGQTDTSKGVCIGTCVQTYSLPQPLNSITGMAFVESDKEKLLYVFEGKSNKIFRYRQKSSDHSLALAGEIELPAAGLYSPRGLACTENVLYFLDYKKEDPRISLLYKYDMDTKKLTSIDLDQSVFTNYKAEIFGVAVQGNSLLISYDPNGYSSHTERVMHGVVMISLDGTPKVEKQMPGPGRTIAGNRVDVSRALTNMTVDGTEYLWGTVGRDYIYLLDGVTGRGIFFFEKPGSPEIKPPYSDAMAFGDGYLWVAEQTNGTDLILRINVLNNLKAAYEGPKRLRQVRMVLTSNVEKKVDKPKGTIYQTYCHPYPTGILGRQGIIPNSVRTKSLTDAQGTKIEHLIYNPAGDKKNQQGYTLVTYQPEQNPDIRSYQSEFIINAWTREYKQFIYPHLTDRGSKPDGDYLTDDTVLYKIKSSGDTYKKFISRVTDYIRSLYNIEPEMENPYWAARNIKEYVNDNYHYPNDAAGYYADHNFKKGSFNSHPGNIKASLSEDNNYEDNIIACSATSMMSGGIYRSIGLPSRWGGMSQEQTLDKWPVPENGVADEFLQHGEESTVTNGHRINQVWLGEFYGWQIFDNTPKKPKNDAFKSRPEKNSQWELMQRSAAGISGVRFIQNLQAEFWPNLYVPLEDGRSINNSGAFRYNLLGTYTNPEDYEMSRQSIRYSALQFIDDINIALDNKLTGKIAWKINGIWGEYDPEASLNVVLEQPIKNKNGENDVPSKFREIAVLAQKLPYTQESLSVDLSKYDAGTYRIKVYKFGDNPTGNAKLFELKKETL